MHPYTQMTIATQHQNDLIAEADRQRLARSARRHTPKQPASPARRWVAAAAAAVLALSLAGAALAAQNGSNGTNGGFVTHRGENCLIVGTGPKLAC